MGPSGRFGGFGDFEPAAAAGVGSPAEQSPLATGRVASQLLEGVGRPGWPLARAAKPTEGGRGWGLQEGLTPHVVPHHSPLEQDGTPAPPRPGLKPQILNLDDVGNPNQEAGRTSPSPVLKSQPRPDGASPSLCDGSVCEPLAPPGGKCLLCSKGFCGWGPRDPGVWAWGWQPCAVVH